MNNRKEPKLDSPYAPKPKHEREALKSVDEAIQEVTDELNAAAHEFREANIPRALNEAIEQQYGPPVPEEPLPEFCTLAERVAEGMVRAAEAVLVEATNLVERTKLEAEQLVQHVRKVGTEVNTLTSRTKTFGQKVLKAHDDFHGEDNA